MNSIENLSTYSSSSSSSSSNNGCTPHLRRVRAEPVSEKSFVSSVRDFIHDIVIERVPQSISQSAGLASSSSAAASKRAASLITEIKEPIEWIRFEHVHTSAVSHVKSAKHRTQLASNLLIVIGYKTGFSIWCIDVSAK